MWKPRMLSAQLKSRGSPALKTQDFPKVPRKDERKGILGRQLTLATTLGTGEEVGEEGWPCPGWTLSPCHGAQCPPQSNGQTSQVQNQRRAVTCFCVPSLLILSSVTGL